MSFSNNGYIIYQLHNLMPYPANRAEKDFFPKENDFNNLGFLTLDTDIRTGMPRLNTNDDITEADMLRWMDIWELKSDFWSPDELSYDFRMTMEAEQTIRSHTLTTQ